MPEAVPLVRTRLVQDWLEHVERVDEPWRRRFFERLAPADRAAIEDAPRLGWIETRYHVLLADVMHEAFGPTRAHDFYRRAFVASLSGPVLGSLFKTGAKLFGVTPASFARWIGKGWHASFKDTGDASGEVLEPGRARVTYRDLPAVCIASEPWLVSAQGSAYGIYDLVGCEGVVRQDLSDRAKGMVRLELEWTDRLRR